MARSAQASLSRRERQIMDILYRQERATAGNVMAVLQGTPSYSTVRTQLRVLEAKGHVRHEQLGLRYIYMPMVPRQVARKLAFKHLAATFFGGSPEQVVAAVLRGEAARVPPEGVKRIAELVALAQNKIR